ncbi:EamA family transporter [Desulforudis sp. 1088]|uniref:EamA family transporter n=1 Tax=unclassified Candidatus Desulforudis TaxID=2635950 RepID=UPI003BBEB4C3
MSYVLAVCAVLLGTSGQVLWKLGVGSKAYGLSALLSPAVLGGFVLYGLSALVWLKVLSKMPLSVAYPLLALNFILVPLASSRFLGEPFTAAKLLGAILIVTGIGVAAR